MYGIFITNFESLYRSVVGHVGKSYILHQSMEIIFDLINH